MNRERLVNKMARFQQSSIPQCFLGEKTVAFYDLLLTSTGATKKYLGIDPKDLDRRSRTFADPETISATKFSSASCVNLLGNVAHSSIQQHPLQVSCEPYQHIRDLSKTLSISMVIKDLKYFGISFFLKNQDLLEANKLYHADPLQIAAELVNGPTHRNLAQRVVWDIPQLSSVLPGTLPYKMTDAAKEKLEADWRMRFLIRLYWSVFVDELAKIRFAIKATIECSRPIALVLLPTKRVVALIRGDRTFTEAEELRVHQDLQARAQWIEQFLIHLGRRSFALSSKIAEHVRFLSDEAHLQDFGYDSVFTVKCFSDPDTFGDRVYEINPDFWLPSSARGFSHDDFDAVVDTKTVAVPPKYKRFIANVGAARGDFWAVHAQMNIGLSERAEPIITPGAQWAGWLHDPSEVPWNDPTPTSPEQDENKSELDCIRLGPDVKPLLWDELALRQ